MFYVTVQTINNPREKDVRILGIDRWESELEVNRMTVQKKRLRDSRRPHESLQRVGGYPGSLQRNIEGYCKGRHRNEISYPKRDGKRKVTLGGFNCFAGTDAGKVNFHSFCGSGGRTGETRRNSKDSTRMVRSILFKDASTFALVLHRK